MSNRAAQRALLQRLQGMAREHTTTAANYVRPVSNGPVFRRLLSGHGLSSAQSISYPIPSEANLVDLATDPSTAVRRVVLAPYGLAADLVSLSQDAPHERQIHQRPSAHGATPFVQVRQYVHSGRLAAATLLSAAKTVSLVGEMVRPGSGVSAHFVVTRDGLILQTAALDDLVYGTEETGLFQNGVATDILICYESAALTLAEDFRARRPNFLEAPLTDVQANSIAFVLKKLSLAFNITPMLGYAARAGTVRPGFTTQHALVVGSGQTPTYSTYAFQDDLELADDLSLVDATPTEAERQLQLLYGPTSSFDGIEARLSDYTFDLATEVYLPPPTEPTENPTIAIAALQQTNTNDVQAYTEMATANVAARIRSLESRLLSDSQSVALRISEHLVARDELRAQALNLVLSDDDVRGGTGQARTLESHAGGELFDFTTGHWTGNGRNVT